MRRRDAIEAITGAVMKCLCNEGLLLNSAKWNESDHPRDERGRFTSGGGSSKSSRSDKGGSKKSKQEMDGKIKSKQAKRRTSPFDMDNYDYGETYGESQVLTCIIDIDGEQTLWRVKDIPPGRDAANRAADALIADRAEFGQEIDDVNLMTTSEFMKGFDSEYRTGNRHKELFGRNTKQGKSGRIVPLGTGTGIGFRGD